MFTLRPVAAGFNGIRRNVRDWRALRHKGRHRAERRLFAAAADDAAAVRRGSGTTCSRRVTMS
jgi:hypothetical protein